MTVDPAELEINKLQEINAYRSRILDKEYGEVVPAERTSEVINSVRSLLEAAPEAEGKFYGLFPQKERIHLAVDSSNPSELYVVTLYRRHDPDGGPDADEIKIRRHFVQPIMEVVEGQGMVPSETRSEITSEEVEFFMLGDPNDPEPKMWVNIAQDDLDENERINIDFVGECALNGIDADQLKSLPEDQKKKMGMFLRGDALLAKREVRQNPDDLMSLGIIEYALKNGEKLTVDELHKRVDKIEK